MKKILTLLCLSCFSAGLMAEDNSHITQILDLTRHPIGYAALFLFFFAYILAMFEEITALRKSKPMVLSASLIWVFIAALYTDEHREALSEQAFRSSLLGFVELFLFLMVSMTYLNAMEDRGVFDKLKTWLLHKRMSYRKIFWLTGILAFILSSVCNNMTTALLMGSVIMSVGRENRRFVGLACVNVVVATNAGGSFSPFGDITTLLVWQKDVVPFMAFFSLLIPSIVNFVVPAMIMHFFIPRGKPTASHEDNPLKRGAVSVIILFMFTIITAITFENVLSLPPAGGMLMGLTYLKFLSFYLQKTGDTAMAKSEAAEPDENAPVSRNKPFDVFEQVSALEWDTMLFFYGVMVSVGGLSFIGYLHVASDYLYTDLDPTIANVLVGIISAFIDNGTIMYAVLTMNPAISQGQWLLVTLTAGVGGSLLAIGSAAGVGLLGQTKGIYTFGSHIKWMPVIALGYAASIATHFIVNGNRF
ncbi:MAG: sodium:proton antiporter NhaD [Methylococcaceae bacterium]